MIPISPLVHNPGGPIHYKDVIPGSSVGGSSWGESRVALSLPFGQVIFHGISEWQENFLSEAYPEYLQAPGTEYPGLKLDCHAWQVADIPQLSSEELGAYDQYTPRKFRNDRGVSIVGVNFEAYLEFGSNPSGHLSVVSEAELVAPDVVENFLRIYAAHCALEQGGVLLHSAGLVMNESAYVFVGRSEAGKTTLTRKAFASGATILSDDINLLLPSSTGFDAFSIPFSGEFGRTIKQTQSAPSYPVSAIVFLEKSDKLAVSDTGKSDAVSRLLVGSPFVNHDIEESGKLFDVCGQLVENVPVFTLCCRKEDWIGDIMTELNSRLNFQ